MWFKKLSSGINAGCGKFGVKVGVTVDCCCGFAIFGVICVGLTATLYSNSAVALMASERIRFGW